MKEIKRMIFFFLLRRINLYSFSFKLHEFFNTHTCTLQLIFFTFPLFTLPLLNPNDFSNSISSLSSFLNISNFILIRCTRYKNTLIFN